MNSAVEAWLVSRCADGVFRWKPAKTRAGWKS